MENMLPPFSGSHNPENGVYISAIMRRIMGRKNTGASRLTVASKVKALMAIRFADSSNKPKALAKEALVSPSTVERVISGKHGPSVDTLDAIAPALGVLPWQLLNIDTTVQEDLALTESTAQGLNPIEQQLLWFYRNVGEDAQNVLVGKANRLYSQEHPNDRSANPYKGAERRKEQIHIKFPGRRAGDVLPKPQTGVRDLHEKNNKDIDEGDDIT